MSMTTIASHEVAPLAGPGRRRGQAVAGLTALLFVVALAMILGWSHWRHSAPSTPSRTPTPVSGVVFTEGFQSPALIRLKHVPLTVAGTTSAGLHITRHLATNTQGRFRLHLPTGHYVISVVLVGRGFKNATVPRSTFSVRAGQPTHVRLDVHNTTAVDQTL